MSGATATTIGPHALDLANRRIRRWGAMSTLGANGIRFNPPPEGAPANFLRSLADSISFIQSVRGIGPVKSRPRHLDQADWPEPIRLLAMASTETRYPEGTPVSLQPHTGCRLGPLPDRQFLDCPETPRDQEDDHRNGTSRNGVGGKMISPGECAGGYARGNRQERQAYGPWSQGSQDKSRTG